MYSLGYNIPNTRKIKFERCEVETVVYTEKIGDVTLSRTANSHIVLSANDDRTTYVLPEQQNEFHSVLFGTDNADILGNLLGAFYVDQEKAGHCLIEVWLLAAFISILRSSFGACLGAIVLH